MPKVSDYYVIRLFTEDKPVISTPYTMNEIRITINKMLEIRLFFTKNETVHADLHDINEFVKGACTNVYLGNYLS